MMSILRKVRNNKNTSTFKFVVFLIVYLLITVPLLIWSWGSMFYNQPWPNGYFFMTFPILLISANFIPGDRQVDNLKRVFLCLYSLYAIAGLLRTIPIMVKFLKNK